LLARDVVRSEFPPGEEKPAPDAEAPANADATPAPAPAPDGRGEEDSAEGEELAEALVTMALSEAELAFLASPELGAIGPKDPRAVKRMLNTYRVIRGRLGAEARAEFVGEGGRPPAFPVLAILLALECDPIGPGLGAALDLLRKYAEDEQIKEQPAGDGAAAGQPILDALAAADKLRPGLLRDPAAWQAWTDTVRRFSFRDHQRL